MNLIKDDVKMNKQVKIAIDKTAFNPTDFINSRMTVKQAMECFDVCRTTILNWEKRNILIPQRYGRRVYYMVNQETLKGDN